MVCISNHIIRRRICPAKWLPIRKELPVASETMVRLLEEEAQTLSSMEYNHEIGRIKGLDVSLAKKEAMLCGIALIKGISDKENRGLHKPSATTEELSTPKWIEGRIQRCWKIEGRKTRKFNFLLESGWHLCGTERKKGMEDLKMKEEDTHDYVDDRYLSMNGTLYHFKINSFPRFISFLDLVKIDKLVYPNWEIMGKKFMELLEWFYIDFMGQEVLGNLPPEIGLNKIDLLALYKFVDDMGGYMIVSLDKKWGKVAELFGLGQEHQDEVKELYKEYIGNG
ncbi:ARID DNA-binding domain-containing protein [Tanacetum coccineum]